MTAKPPGMSAGRSADHPHGEAEFLKSGLLPWSAEETSRNSDVLWKMMLRVTHDGWAPGKPESGQDCPRDLGGLCLNEG